MLLLHCNRNPNFLSTFLGNTDIEQALKEAITLMRIHKLKEGKSLILRAAHLQLNFPCVNGKYNCFGSEYSTFLCLFNNVWMLQVKQKCISPYCPNKNRMMIRNQITFSIPAFYSSTDILGIFPKQGDRCYCGSQFPGKPPDKAPYAVSGHTDVTAGVECKGDVVVTLAEFIRKPPWVIPISIEAISIQKIHKLPLTFSLYDHQYQLGGCSINTGRHFTSIVVWHGRAYFYDGMKHSRSLRFIPYNPDILCSGFQLGSYRGSYAYYFVQ